MIVETQYTFGINKRNTMTKSWNDLEDVKQTSYEDFNNLLILDGNNLAYRFIQRPNYNNYLEEYQRTVHSLAKSYKAKRTIVCFDFGKSYYRMGLHDAYKGTRKKPETEEEIQHAEAFFEILNALPDDLDDEVLKFRGVEADDLIAYLSQNLAKKYDHTWIVSSDKDLLQLIDTNISIFNIFSRKEITLESLQETLTITPEVYMLSRIVEGDKSDNIIGVEGIGPKRAQSLAKEYKTFENLLAAIPVPGKAKYIHNLNCSLDKIVKNEKLINLKKYHINAIEAGVHDSPILDILAENYN